MESEDNTLLDNYIILFKTLIQKIVTVIVSIFIVLNLIIRSNVDGDVLYPHDATKMPYVKHCKNKMSDATGKEFCPNAKDIDSFEDMTEYNNVFKYINTNDETNTPFDKEKHGEGKYVKLLQQNSMYLSAARFQNLGILTKKDFKFPFNPLFLAYLVTIRSQRSINKILSMLHNTIFRTTKQYKVLFLILTMFVVIMMDNMTKTGGTYDMFNNILRVSPDNLSLLGYILKLAYSTFGGFFVFFKLLGFLFIPILLVIVMEYISANPPINMLISKIFAVFITASFGTLAASFTANPDNPLGQFKGYIKGVPSLLSFKNRSGFGVIWGILIYLLISMALFSGFLSIVPVMFAGFLTITKLAFDIGISWLFKPEIREKCLELFKNMLPAIKLIIIIFSIDVINQTLGKNASLLSILLFTIFLLFDYFNGDGKSVAKDFMNDMADPNIAGLKEE